MLRQRTIRHTIRAKGVGLHTGAVIRMALLPAPPSTGVVFRRTDLPGQPEVSAHANRVVDTRLCTSLGHGSARVGTVEHLLSALSGLGIDNIIIEVDGPEVPILDGSAYPFVFLLKCGEVIEQDAPKELVKILRTVEVHSGDSWARLTPFDGFKVDVSISFAHPLIPTRLSSVSLDFGKTSFVDSVARARTFGFVQDIEALRAQGFAQGGTLDNAIFLDKYRILNEDGLRYPDEMARHKALDVVGDLFLFGRNLIGAFEAYKPGHALNHTLLRTVMADSQAWMRVSYPKVIQAPAPYDSPIIPALATV